MGKTKDTYGLHDLFKSMNISEVKLIRVKKEPKKK